jgi:glycosidase
MKKAITRCILSCPLLTASALGNSWLKDAVFYEVFVRSYYDSNADGIGDFRGLEMKLDYIKQLGANALWLMPIFKSPSYHGYDTVDYYQVNEDYGTMEDFDSLLIEADKHGIRIILDLVVNHTSLEHPWIQKYVENIAPYNHWYLWEKTRPGGKRSVYGKAKPVEGGGWRYNAQRKQFYYAHFSKKMPELDLRNTAVRQEVKKIAKFWLDKGVAGFRLDAAQLIIEEGPGKKQSNTQATIQWWIEFSQYVKSLNPQAILVGEVWDEHSQISKYHVKGKGLDLCFDFPFQSDTLKAVGSGSVKSFIDMVAAKKKLPAPLSFYAPFLANHDQDRYMTSLDNDSAKARMAAIILLTAPGTPFIYYGEEIGMYHRTKKVDHLLIRTPMQWDQTKVTAGFTSAKAPWHKINDNKAPYNVRHQRRSPDSLLKLYQKLIRLRLEHPELRYGDYKFHSVGKNVLAYEKVYEKSAVLVLINPSGKEQTIRSRRISGSYCNLLNGEAIEVTPKYVMPPGSCYLLEPIER